MPIAFVQGAVGSFHSTNGTISATINAGDTVVVVISVSTSTSPSGVTVSDSGGSTYTLRSTLGNVFIFTTAAGGALASTSVTVSMATSAWVVVSIGDYSGVSSLGATSSNFGSGTAPFVTVSVANSGSWLVGGFGGYGKSTVSSATGSLRESQLAGSGSPGNWVSGTLVDNTGSTSDTCSITLSSSESWQVAAAELKGAGGGSVTASDSESFSERLTRSAAHSRAASDPASFSDSAAGHKGVSRTATDSVSFSESVARGLALAPAPADTVAFSEAPGRLTAESRAASDSASLSDSAVGNKGSARTASDSASFSDSVTANKGTSASASDTLSLSEGLARSTVASRTASDTAALGESLPRNSAASRSLSDALTFSDAATAVGGAHSFNVAATDTFSVSDTPGRSVALGRAVTDVLSPSEAIARLVAAQAAASDSSAFSDSATGAGSLQSPPTEGGWLRFRNIQAANARAQGTFPVRKPTSSL
jgi:hypothetical protein